MEDENYECLKLHGYISSSETESEVDDSKFELDEQFEAFKPPPLNINPEKHKIIVVDGTTPRKMSKSKKRKLRKKRGKLLALSGINNYKGGESSRSKQPKDCDNYPNNCDNNVLEKKFPLLGDDIRLQSDDTIKEKTKQQKSKKNQKNGDGMEEERKTEKQVRETKNPLLHYVDNVGNIINIMKCLAYTDKCIRTMYDIQDIDSYNSDVASIVKFYYKCDLSRVLERTLHYIKYCMDLAVQSNYAFTKEFLCHIETECASIVRIATLYNDFYTEYKAILKHIFIINGEKPNSCSDIALINYVSDVVCTLMKNILNGMKRPKSALFPVSHEEFSLLCNNLHIVVTSYVEITLETVMLLAETMKKTLNQKNGLSCVPRTHWETVKTRKLSLMGLSATYVDILKDPCAFIEDFWARNRDFDEGITCKGIVTIKASIKNVDPENLLNYKLSGEDLSLPPPYQPVIVEDMTRNKKYLYDGSYHSSEPVDSWSAFNSRYLNEDIGNTYSSKISSELNVTSMENIYPENSLNDNSSSQTQLHQPTVTVEMKDNQKYFCDCNYQRPEPLYSGRTFHNNCHLNEDPGFNAKSVEIMDGENLLNVKSSEDSSQIQLYQSIIIEDLTKDRHYFYDGSYLECDSADLWKSFQSRYLNENMSNMYSESKYNTVINGHFIPSHMEVETLKPDDCNVIEDDLNSDFRGVAKFLLIYFFLKQPWFLNLVVSFIVVELDIIILIFLLVYLSVQFIINC